MRHLVCILMFVLGSLISAHAQQQPREVRPTRAAKPTPPPAAPAGRRQKAGNVPVLLFEKTPCFGTCPAYKAALYRNGTLDYEGLSHVNLLGKHQLHLPAATVTYILKEAKRLDFAHLPDVYTQHATDLPSTYLSIMQPTCNLKQVRVEEGAPEALNKLLDYIHQQIMQVAVVTK